MPDEFGRLSARALDQTARLSRRGPDDTGETPLGAAIRMAAARRVSPGFLWPAPPSYQYAGAEGAIVEGDCLIVLRDGQKASGTLLDFSPDSEVLKLRQHAAGAIGSIRFSDFLRIELVAPVRISRQRLPGRIEQGGFEASDGQPFTIRLSNGSQFQGYTVGYIEALCGLFLFLPDQLDSVVRHFIPAHAIADHRIGVPFGQMLVDQSLASPEAVDAALQKQAAMRSKRLGEYLTENRIVSPEQLAAALRRQNTGPVLKLGESLVELGFLSPEELAQALAIEARNRTVPLGQILTDMGVVDARVVSGVMAKKLGIPSVTLRAFQIAPEILRRIPATVAHRYQVVPLAELDGALVVAVEDPMNLAKMEEVRFAAGSKLIPVMAAAEDIAEALQRDYGNGGDADSTPGSAAGRAIGNQLLQSRAAETDMPVAELASRLSNETADTEVNELDVAHSDTTLVKLVNKIILDAVAQGASDIHVEANAGAKGTRVRFRKDGVMITYIDLPAKFCRALVSRLKIMSQLDITERRRAQDGKIDFSRYGPARVELRVATIPTANGLEDVVMRLLSSATPVPIADIGFDAAMLAAIERLMTRAHGLFLVCGPTGSGKTTTLHSLLAHLNTDERKIWTAEDPVEIVQSGLRQVQVNAKIGWTFAAAMRSLMRADPDVIMVGEMRDAETGKIGVEASLTGHLVLSTLHTNSAPESVTRLLDFGIDPFNFADALVGVLSQRLVRRLCVKCKIAYAAADEELRNLSSEYCGGDEAEGAALLPAWRVKHADAEGKIRLYRARGCEHCDRTGYRGRIGVYELLVSDAALKHLIQVRAPISEIDAAATANGMRTLKQDGIGKILQGHTDIQQVRTV